MSTTAPVTNADCAPTSCETPSCDQTTTVSGSSHESEKASYISSRKSLATRDAKDDKEDQILDYTSRLTTAESKLRRCTDVLTLRVNERAAKRKIFEGAEQREHNALATYRTAEELVNELQQKLAAAQSQAAALKHAACTREAETKADRILFENARKEESIARNRVTEFTTEYNKLTAYLEVLRKEGEVEAEELIREDKETLHFDSARTTITSTVSNTADRVITIRECECEESCGCEQPCHCEQPCKLKAGHSCVKKS
jgi:hypothetical protein